LLLSQPLIMYSVLWYLPKNYISRALATVQRQSGTLHSMP